MLFGNAIKLDIGLFLTPAERNASVLTKPLSESASELLRIQDELINYAKESLQLTDSQRLGYYDPERSEFASGDHVLVNYRTGAPPTRLHTKWKGPLRVISNHFSHYTLLDLVTNKDKVYHITDLKDFFFDPSIHDPLDIARKDYLEFLVEKVLAHKGDPKRKKSLEFHIKWHRYESSYSSWEPWHNFKDVEFLHDYLRDNNMSFLIPKKFK